MWSYVKEEVSLNNGEISKNANEENGFDLKKSKEISLYTGSKYKKIY